MARFAEQALPDPLAHVLLLSSMYELDAVLEVRSTVTWPTVPYFQWVPM